MLGQRTEKVAMLYISLITRPFLDLVAMAATVTLLYTILSLFIQVFWTFFFLVFTDAGSIELFAGTSMFIIAIWSLMSMAIHMIESFSDSIEDVIHGGLFNRLQSPDSPMNRIESTIQGAGLAGVVSGANSGARGNAGSFARNVKDKRTEQLKAQKEAKANKMSEE